VLDPFYITIYNYYQKAYGKRSITLAAIYINLLHSSILWLFSLFALVFAQQMKLPVMSNTKFFILYGLMIIGIIFKNWLYYSGKKRNILKSKRQGKPHAIGLLWALPFGCFLLGYLLYQLR
jgi:hypothetical protein